MQQQFNTRNYSVRDFEEWQERDELTLAPKFQRREVWSPNAKSFLMDTIIKGKPIPKLYMRQNISPATRKTTREIVDGQQRLRTVLSFIKNGFKLSRAHDRVLGGKTFSQLDTTIQGDILKYEFVVDLLQDMPDPEVYDLFARINTYSERLKPQELRHAKWFGEFRSSVYELARQTVTFFELNKVFTSKNILRMAEAELISELLLALEEGIREGNKKVIDAAYKAYDDKFPNRALLEKRFVDVIDTIAAIMGDSLPGSRFRALRLFYPLFLAIYHMKYGLPRLTIGRRPLKVSDYPKIKNVLETVEGVIEAIDDGSKPANEDDKRLFEAQDEHSVHAANRTVLTTQLCKRITHAIK